MIARWSRETIWGLIVSARGLPTTYEAEFDALLSDVAVATDPSVPLLPFWPLRGAGYDGDLLVIGRSVNGWVADWTAGQIRDGDVRGQVLDWMRRDAELAVGDRMAWVTDLWGATTGYNTRRSALWRVLADLTSGLGDPAWPGRLVWTNLYKVSPAAGWNPGVDLQRAQRARAGAMLRTEVETYQPRRVLAMTGDWIHPFLASLDLELTRASGLVTGTATRAGVAWVVAKHPMGKPHAPFVAAVRAAFADSGAPLP